MLRHRGVGDGELVCQHTAAEGAGMLECQRHNRFADFRIRLLQLLIFSHALASGATHKSGTLFPLLAGRQYLNRWKQAKVTPLRERQIKDVLSYMGARCRYIHSMAHTMKGTNLQRAKREDNSQ